MAVPDSVALPFGTFERTLKDPCNSNAALGISACMEDLEREAKQKSGIPLALAQLRHLVRRTLRPPAALMEEAAVAAEAAGLVSPGTWTEDSPAWESAWSAICQVSLQSYRSVLCPSTPLYTHALSFVLAEDGLLTKLTYDEYACHVKSSCQVLMR